MRSKLLYLSLSGALLLAALPAQASKISKDLRGRSKAQAVNVIVQFTKAPQNSDFEKIGRKGGMRKKHFAATKAAAYTVSAEQLESIAADPNVRYISPDRPVRTRYWDRCDRQRREGR
jgi:hypothetical protein